MATSPGNWTLDANEGNAVGGLSTVQKGNATGSGAGLACG
jgi:hypothetical protein